MKVKLQSKDLEELFIEKCYPDSFSTTHDGGIKERVYSAELIGGHGTYREVFMENILISYGDMQMKNQTEIVFDSYMETVEMHFALKGKTYAEECAGQQTFTFDCNQHNILYASHFSGRMLYPPIQNVKIFEINLLPDFFKRFLPEGEKMFTDFIKSIDRQQTKLFSPHHYPITPEMHWLIQDILNCDRKGLFKRLFLEAKVTELLLLQLEQISASKKTMHQSLKKVELEKIHAVKDHLKQHLDEPYTILELAHLFGTNEYSLKKNFKATFGTTIFNYWNAIKMNHAKQMLLDESVTIREIADQVGYKNPQHFSTAFKKRFGYSPSQVR
ncbi:MAG: AraC family transcriptional regulator [Bacteroidota bacterium]